jgi:hypothetical protein
MIWAWLAAGQLARVTAGDIGGEPDQVQQFRDPAGLPRPRRRARPRPQGLAEGPGEGPGDGAPRVERAERADA